MLGCPAQGHRLLCAFQRRSCRPHTPHYTLYCPLCPVPHYSSSIFKREYALLQLVCLEANLSRLLQWTASPLLCPLTSLLFYFCCVFLINHVRCRYGGWRTGGDILHIYIYIYLDYATTDWDIERHSEDVGTQKWGRGGDRKVEESNLFFFMI